MKKQKEITKAQRIEKEEKRLRALYIDLPKDKRSLYEGLINRAAYMRVTLEDYEKDLDLNGYVDSFQQSEKLDSYERERPVARLYNTMNKNYQSIIKQLNDALPESIPEDAGDEINKFLSGAK